MKELYFENVTGIGNLYLEYVFYEFESEPILFLCLDESRQLYFCLCSDIRYEQKWVVMKTNLTVLNALVEEEIDIASAFLSAPELVIITLNLQGEERVRVVRADEADRLDLPKEGTFVRCGKEEAKMYLWQKKWEMVSDRQREIVKRTEASDEVMQKAFFVNTIYKGAVEPESRLRDTISESYEYSVSSKEEYIETVKISKNDNDFVQAA